MNTVGARLRRALLPVALAAIALTGLAAPAQAGPPSAMIDVSCWTPVSYGDEVDCRAASVDTNGDYGVPGTFTFDPGGVLPAGWESATCQVSQTSCSVIAHLAIPPHASPRTFTFPVRFLGTDGSTASEPVSIDVGLRPTLSTIVCDPPQALIGASVHCVVSVADTHAGVESQPAQLPDSVAGLTIASSDLGDRVTYDRRSADGSTCVAEVSGDVLACGFTVALDDTYGLHTLRASYPGDPAADEVSSRAMLTIPNGLRRAPAVALTCPASVPAKAATTTCAITVTDPSATGPVPTGLVEVDQSTGSPADFVNGDVCTLVDGSCSVSYTIFESPGLGANQPVRALYSGDDSYQPGSDSQPVAITPTPTVSATSCDTASPVAGSVLHCTFTVSTVDGFFAPVSPRDAITVGTSSGSVRCALSAAWGCGHVDTQTTTTAAFTVQLGPAVGPESVSGFYTGDDDNYVAASTASFDLVTVAPARPPIVPQPPVSKAASQTAVSCGALIAYRQAERCTVKVTSVAGVPTGTVRVAPDGPRPVFAATSCALDATGQCVVSVTGSSPPLSRVDVIATYSGSDEAVGSAGLAHFSVRAVDTSVSLRCTHSVVSATATVHCVASVRTEFGAAAGVPAAHSAQVTVSARGDAVVYDGGKTCHWKVSGHTLNCGFTVRTGHPSGVRIVRVHYPGGGSANDAASLGTTKLTVRKS
jgi:hypothetical protein